MFSGPIFSFRNLVLLILIGLTLAITGFWLQLIPFYLTSQSKITQLPKYHPESHITGMFLFGLPFIPVALESKQSIHCDFLWTRGQLVQVKITNDPLSGKTYQGFHILAPQATCP